MKGWRTRSHKCKCGQRISALRDVCRKCAEGAIATTMKTVHLSQSIRGLLHYSDRELHQALNWITHDNGQRFNSAAELREALIDEIARGHELLPTGPCEGFSPKTGCPGHSE